MASFSLTFHEKQFEVEVQTFLDSVVLSSKEYSPFHYDIYQTALPNLVLKYFQSVYYM